MLKQVVQMVFLLDDPLTGVFLIRYLKSKTISSFCLSGIVGFVDWLLPYLWTTVETITALFLIGQKENMNNRSCLMGFLYFPSRCFFRLRFRKNNGMSKIPMRITATKL